MGEVDSVQVRQWGPGVYAVYVFDGDPNGSFICTSYSRSTAHDLGVEALAARGKERENTSAARILGGVGP
jgi:hypothetical protein